MSTKTKCGCPEEAMLMVEYGVGDNCYDGVSEYECTQCGQRVGRWSGNILKEGKEEPRFGIQHKQLL